jgi:hypothetical protein
MAARNEAVEWTQHSPSYVLSRALLLLLYVNILFSSAATHAQYRDLFVFILSLSHPHTSPLLKIDNAHTYQNFFSDDTNFT